MSNISEIMKKADFIQNGGKTNSNEDYLSYYRMGKMCYAIKDYDGADKEVLKDRFRNTAIRKMCAKIDTYERMSATYISNNLPENAPEIEEGIGGYDLLDTLDDEYIDKMRSSLHVWDEIQKMA